MSAALPMALWLPPALACAAAVVALVADAGGKRAFAVWSVVAGLAGAGIAGLVSAADVEPGVAVFAWGGGFSGLPALGYLVSAVAVASGTRILVSRERGAAMAAMVALGAIFAHALGASFDALATLAGLVGLTVVGLGLVAGRGDRRAEEAAVKYLVQGVVAGAFMVLGVGLVFGLAGGASDFARIGAAIGTAGERPVLLALGLIVATFAFKLGAFPFHAWVPDVYETADEAVVAFVSSVPKIAAALALLMLVRGPVFAQAVPERVASGVLLTIAVTSLLVGSFGMLAQRSVGRMLGYSAIAQAGYAVLAIALGEKGVHAVVVIVATYAVGVCAAFVSLGAVRVVLPGWDGSLDGLAGLSRRAPLVAASLATAMLSLTGIPLFAGFWGKLMLLETAVAAGRVELALAVALAAVVSFGGYGSVVRAAYFGGREAGVGPAGAGVEAGVPAQGPAPASASQRAAAVALAVALIAGGIAPLVWGTGAVYALFAVG